MGGGHWDEDSYSSYTTSTRGVDAKKFATTNYSVQEVYTSKHLAPELKPYKVMRECCDSEEHPFSFPVILALDVTGSMGNASVNVAKKLNEIMTALYTDSNVRDIEFCIMGIGDLAYDHAPIQMSQFESDVRIAEQLDKIYFEAGGGGNRYESYTAAWYMGLNHSKLDCWERGQKGIIITMGDEGPNPYLPCRPLANETGDSVQSDIETKDLYEQVLKKYNVYHISVDDEDSSYSLYQNYWDLDKQWTDLLGQGHYFVSSIDNLADTIISIIKSKCREEATFVITSSPSISVNENNEVTW